MEATHGLTALLSARIALYDHQVQVIRRVLEDTVQRYLLADEVGLGKTIEAGVILRQLLLDKPNARVLLLAPPALTPQWKKELADKLMVRPAAPSMTFGDTDDLNSLTAESYDMVIVDEAHHPARLAFDARRVDAWRKLAAVCQQSPRLLLLSATPALHNEDAFLAMLHLLEPKTYPLDDVVGFRARVRNRDAVASALDLVQVDMSRPREIWEAAEALRTSLPEDNYLMGLAGELERAADAARAQKTTADVSALARRIRLHICETHRVHRRMLRSSRRLVPDGLLPKRSDGRLTYEEFTDRRFARTQYALDIWRESAGLAAGDRDTYLELFARFMDLAATWPPLLRAALRHRLGSPDPFHVLPDVFRDVLTGTPLFEGEREQLEQWERDLADDPDERNAIGDLLDTLQRRRLGRTVVFTSYTAAAEEIVARLPTIMNRRFVYSHLATTPPGERYALLERFATEQTSAVLVCDRTGEEGLNLQFVDRVVHFDLPWDINRLEQRIGRLDRIGRTKASAPHHVFIPKMQETSFAEALLHLAADGVAVFRESVADLQFFLDQKREWWVRKAFREGADALLDESETEGIGEAIKKERILLRKQAALDETEAYETDDTPFAANLREEDGDTRQAEFDDALSGWLIRSWRLDRARDGFPFRYNADHCLLPKDRWDEITHCVPPDQPFTYKRQEALDSPGRALLRPGNPFVDNLIRYMEWEDRGQAWALWRRLPEGSFPPGEMAYFRFDVVADADPSHLAGATPNLTDLERRPLLRLMQGLLPPRFREVFVDARSRAVVRDERIRSVLLQEYDKSHDNLVLGARLHDTNLKRAERRAVLAEVLPDYRSDLAACLDAARDAVTIEPGFMESVAKSVRRTETAQEIRMDQLRRGLVYRGQNANLGQEERTYRAIIAGIREPRLRFDSIGLIVLSERNPFGEDPERSYDVGGTAFPP
jgi:ATP-dependent helicase HepA